MSVTLIAVLALLVVVAIVWFASKPKKSKTQAEETVSVPEETLVPETQPAIVVKEETPTMKAKPKKQPAKKKSTKKVDA